ncbi:MAG: hypothetical protein HEQ23_02620 [Tepidisphaera sp.]
MALMVAAGVTVPSVMAQPLAAGVIGAANIGETEKKTIEDFVALHIKDLASGEAEKVRKGKNALVNPLLERVVSVPFRLEYSRVLLAADLANLCKDKNDTVAINALRLAGEVAENGTVALVEEGFKDTRSAIRYAAVFAAGRSFEQVMPAGRAVAVTSGRLEQLVRSTAAVMNKDKEEALVVDGASRALLAAARVDFAKYEGVGKSAMVEVAKGLSTRLAKAGPDDTTIVEAGQRAATQFTETLGGAKGAQIDKDARKEAATLGGELAAWVVRQLNTAKIPQIAKGDEAEEATKKRKEREPFKTTLAAAENVVLSALKASGANPPMARLVPAFDQGDRGGDANVVVQTKDWLIRDVLAKAPFEVSADRFKLTN